MRPVEVVVDGRALVGESPAWDAATGTLLWVDVLRREVRRHDPRSGADVLLRRLPCPVGAVVPRADGRVAVAAGMGVALLDPASGELAWLAHADRGDRMNDAACDPAGRLWAGTLTIEQTPGAAALYRLDGHEFTRVLDDVGLSNGLGWSPDGSTVYYVDTPTQRVDAFDYDLGAGSISNRRTFVDLRELPGRPDGLTVDAAGGVWVAMARGGAVRRFTERGAADEVIAIGTPRVTSCAFGGAGLRDLYVTTSCVGLDEAALVADPLAGALLRIPEVGVCGLPTHTFEGGGR